MWQEARTLSRELVVVVVEFYFLQRGREGVAGGVVMGGEGGEEGGEGSVFRSAPQGEDASIVDSY